MLRDYLHQVCHALGLSTRIVPHLRHTYATEMLRAGVGFPVLMKLLGHTSPEMTMRYLDVALTDLQREFQRARSQPRHLVPQPKVPLARLRGGLDGVVDSLLAAQHVLEMFRRWPAVLAAQEHAQRVAQSSPANFQFFSSPDATEVEAIATQVIPSDHAPGAREAHVIYFIDRVLVTFERDKQPAYTQGLQDLQHRTQELFPDVNRFSSLTPAQQIQVLTAIEKTESFELVRVHTIMGFLAKPEYGGNYNHAGWKLIGFEDRMIYEPPFGYYDSEYSKGP